MKTRRMVGARNGEHKFVLIFDGENRAEAYRSLGRWAADPRLPFSWVDAARSIAEVDSDLCLDWGDELLPDTEQTASVFVEHAIAEVDGKYESISLTPGETDCLIEAILADLDSGESCYPDLVLESVLAKLEAADDRFREGGDA